MTKEAQPPKDDLEVRAKVSAKLQKVVDRGYIEIVNDPDRVKSFMFMFDVPKGDSDIRMVYDGSRSGFNESIWAPWFALPTVETMTRTVWPGGWCGWRMDGRTDGWCGWIGGGGWTGGRRNGGWRMMLLGWVVAWVMGHG